jgi:hypothetical protein
MSGEASETTGNKHMPDRKTTTPVSLMMYIEQETFLTQPCIVVEK